jgi:nitroreductase
MTDVRTDRASFEDLVLNQRACRRFDPEADVPDSDIARMLTYAVHAPSANNWQPWEFIIVREEKARLQLGALVREHWLASGAKSMKGNVSDSHFKSANDGMANGGFDTAPVVVIACVDHQKVPEMWAAESIYPACQNLLLGAASLGYASCFTTGLTTLRALQVGELLALPERVVPMASIFLGKATRPLGPPRREPAELHTHRETYGTAW